MNSDNPAEKQLDEQLDETILVATGSLCPKCGLEVPASLGHCPADGTSVVAGNSETETLIADYRFTRLIGSGGMGVVYEAENLLLNRKVAIKVMNAHLVSDVAVRRFQQEGRALSQLSHPNILTVYDLKVTPQGQPYMVLEYIAGKSLTELIAERGRLSIDRTLKIFIQVCDALEHAHSKGVFHRDVKPSNIMIAQGDDGKELVKIVDFGIAKLVDPQQSSSPKLTQTGEVVGSPSYMSPEQCQGRTIDHRSDIYSLGCVLYEALTGRPPFTGDSAISTLMQHVSETPASIDQILRANFCPPSLKRATDFALAKSPTDRYQKIAEMRADLAKALTELSSPEDQTKSLIKSRRDAKEVTARIWLACMVVALFVFFSVILDFTGVNKPTVAPSQPVVATAPVIAPQETTYDKELAERIRRNPNMPILDLRLTNVSDEGLTNLPALRALTELDLNRTKVTDRGLQYVGRVKTLKTLVMNRTHITTDGVAQLTGLNELKILDIGHTKINDEVAEYLNKIPKLNELYLSGSNVGDLTLQRLNSQSLEDLDLVRTQVTDVGMKALPNIPRLTSLKLGDKITDVGLAHLSAAKGLKRIDFYGSSSATDEGIRNLKKAIPGLIVTFHEQ